MLASFLAVLFVTARSQSVSLLDYECTENAECAVLKEVILEHVPEEQASLAALITPVCNTADSFCSVNCAGFFSTVCGQLGTAIDITSLYCDDTVDTDSPNGRNWCTVDLTCTVTADCTIPNMENCGTVAGLCIPDVSNECTDNTGCTKAGWGYCDTRTYSGKTVSFCNKEACQTATDCLTDSYICGDMGICVPACDASISTECDAAIYGEGRECGANGECRKPPTEAPSKSPTDNPTGVPSQSPSQATQSPTKRTTDSDIDDSKGGVKRCGVFGTLAVMVAVVAWM